MSDYESRSLTAADLMSRDVVTVSADLSLHEAAAVLARREVHGAPVVDGAGRCVGVLSVTDLARWVAGRDESKARRPQTCSYQEKCREPGGRETTLCCLAEGACPMQRSQELVNGKRAVACIEPNAVPVDWQVVALESLPGETVRDFMTTAVVTAEQTAPVHELARLMLDHRVHRLIVLDGQERPLGVVTVDDLVQVLAHPEIACSGAPQ